LNPESRRLDPAKKGFNPISSSKLQACEAMSTVGRSSEEFPPRRCLFEQEVIWATGPSLRQAVCDNTIPMHLLRTENL